MNRFVDMYAALIEVDAALRNRYESILDDAMRQRGVESSDFSVLLAVVAWEPQLTTAWMFGLRGPYTHLDKYTEWLRGSAQRGFLKEDSTDVYRVTDRGREAYHSLIAIVREAMEPKRSFARTDVDRFAVLLKKIVEASIASPMPPEKWCITWSRFHYPGDNAPVMGRIDQYITDLRSFRDDAHLAAWRIVGLSAPAFESLTFIWRGEATLLDTVCEKLKRRGYSRDVYAAALSELYARGWLSGTDASPQLTDRGREARNQIEARTDELFFRPWLSLAESDLNDLVSLAHITRDVLASGD